MDRDYLTPKLIMYKYFFFVCVKYWCETTDKIWLKWFTQSHTACVHQKSFLARCSSKEQPRVGWDQTGVGMRMARRLERRKVTKHTFSLSPARHTHTHTYVHTNTGPPCRAVCARWGCDAWSLSPLPSLHVCGDCALHYALHSVAHFLTGDTVKHYLRRKAMPSALHSRETSV